MTPKAGDTNQGYEILSVYHTRTVSYVVAVSRTAPDPWVCWRWTPEAGYHYGRYFSTQQSAELFMAQRITGADLATIAAVDGAIIRAAEILGIKWVEDLLDMIDRDLTTPSRAHELEQTAESWRTR